MCAIVSPKTDVDAPAHELAPRLQHLLRERIAGYKVPKHVIVAPEVQRAPSGKADYRWARGLASTMARTEAAGG